MNGKIFMNEIDGLKLNLNIFENLKQLIKKEKDIEEKIKLISKIKSKIELPEKNSILHIATSVYEFGGHTRLIDRFIKNISGKHSLILTKQDGNIPDWLKDTISAKYGEIIKLEGSDLPNMKKLFYMYILLIRFLFYLLELLNLEILLFITIMLTIYFG